MQSTIGAVRPLALGFRALDTLMVPVMKLLGGFKPDCLQETHPWHAQLVPAGLIDHKLAVAHQGSDPTIFRQHFAFLFHISALGGWKDYIVLEVPQGDVFHIGWVMYHTASSKLLQAAVQKLPIHGRRIRMLAGPSSFQGYFFCRRPTRKPGAIAAGWQWCVRGQSFSWHPFVLVYSSAL